MSLQAKYSIGSPLRAPLKIASGIWVRSGQGNTTVHFADGDAGAIGLAEVEVVPSSSIIEVELLDSVVGPLRDATCSPGETVFAQVSLKDAAGRSIAGGGVLVRSLDLQVARVHPSGVGALIDCVSSGRTTIEVVVAGRVSAGLNVRR